MRYLIPIVLLCILGCKTTPKKDSFPVGLEPVCLQQMAASKAFLESKGVSLKKKSAVTVRTMRGTQYVNGMWAWEDAGGLIGGYYSGGNIFVGCNPKTGGDVNPNVLFHEFKHYWLATNKGLYGHNPLYFPEIKMILKAVSIKELIVDKPESFKE